MQTVYIPTHCTKYAENIKDTLNREGLLDTIFMMGREDSLLRTVYKIHKNDKPLIIYATVLGRTSMQQGHFNIDHFIEIELEDLEDATPR